MVLYMSLAGAQIPYGDCNQWIYLDFASVSDGLWGRLNVQIASRSWLQRIFALFLPEVTCRRTGFRLVYQTVWQDYARLRAGCGEPGPAVLTVCYD